MTMNGRDGHPTALLTVAHRGGDRFRIRVRGHEIDVDQPVGDGGEDTAPTPTELFVAALASCVAFYARRYLTRHGLPADGLEVTAGYETGTRPARVVAVRIEVTPPAGLPPQRQDALLAVASHCTVHNTLTTPPAVDIRLANATGAVVSLVGQLHGTAADLEADS
jgi:putative redox protein